MAFIATGDFSQLLGLQGMTDLLRYDDDQKSKVIPLKKEETAFIIDKFYETHPEAGLGDFHR